jgi:hypothetical protein
MNTYPPDSIHSEVVDKNIEAEFSHPIPRDEYPHMDNFNQIFEELTK